MSGVTLVGDHSGDLIAESVLAMKHGLRLNCVCNISPLARLNNIT